jgi:hypothetical protein
MFVLMCLFMTLSLSAFSPYSRFSGNSASSPANNSTTNPQFKHDIPGISSPTRSTASAQSTPLKHVGNALALGLAMIVMKRLPANRFHPRLHTPLLSSDWKEWAKVFLGIGIVNQVTQAMNVKPPVWLQAMINVMVVGPMAAGFTRKNMIQSAILAPVVAGMVQGTQWASNKSEKPLQDHFNISPTVTHALFSFGMVLAGLRIFPWVNGAIPGNAGSQAGRTGLISTCANGCCSSLICVNDIGQLGSGLVHSLSSHDQSKRRQ